VTSLWRWTSSVAVSLLHWLVLLTTAFAAAPISAVSQAISAVAAIKMREDWLLATINQAIPIPIKTRGIGFL